MAEHEQKKGSVQPTQNVSDETWNTAKQVGRRIGFHGVALLIALCITSASGALKARGIDGYTIFLSVYTGLICLFPRGIRSSHTWYLPTGTGVLQWLFTTFSGFPWQLGLLFGGAQTYLQRLIQFKGKLGFEWTAVPILALSLTLTLNYIYPMASLPWSALLSTMVILGALGAFINFCYGKIRGSSIRRNEFERTLNLISSVSFDEKLSKALRTELATFLKRARTFADAAGFKSGAGQEVYERIYSSCRDILGFARTKTGHGTAIPPDLQSLRKAAGFSKFSEDLILERTKELNDYLDQEVRALTPEQAVNDDLSGFDAQVKELLLKKDSLPPDMGESLENLCFSSYKILKEMRTDPRDKDPGQKFLKRYLPAAAKIVDEHLRLGSKQEGSTEVERALKRSLEVMQRLEQAFAKQHEAMLQNDTIEFTAELNALDNFMKMQGV